MQVSVGIFPTQVQQKMNEDVIYSLIASAGLIVVYTIEQTRNKLLQAKMF